MWSDILLHLALNAKIAHIPRTTVKITLPLPGNRLPIWAFLSCVCIAWRWDPDFFPELFHMATSSLLPRMRCIYIFNRNGVCLYYHAWHRPLTTLSAPQDHKLMFGLLFSLRSFTAKMDPTRFFFAFSLVLPIASIFNFSSRTWCPCGCARGCAYPCGFICPCAWIRSAHSKCTCHRSLFEKNVIDPWRLPVYDGTSTISNRQ